MPRPDHTGCRRLVQHELFAARSDGVCPRPVIAAKDTISIFVRTGINTIIIKLITTRLFGMGRDSPLYALIGVVEPGQYRCWEASLVVAICVVSSFISGNIITIDVLTAPDFSGRPR